MQKNKFNIGDSVMLKNDINSPKMIVGSYQEEIILVGTARTFKYYCYWFDKNQNLQNVNFIEELLNPAK